MSDTMYVFHASWCNPCKQYAPIVDEVEKVTGLPVHRIDVEEFPGLTKDYNVSTVPTVVLVGEDSLERDRLTGVLTFNELYDMARPF